MPVGARSRRVGPACDDRGKKTFSEVVRGAAVIAAGTVSTIDAMRDPDQERPFTEVTFEGEDLEMLKRDAGQRPLTPLARTRVAALRQAAVVDPPATADTRQQDLEVFRDCPDCPEYGGDPGGDVPDGVSGVGSGPL